SDARCTLDWITRATSNQGASGSVVAVLAVTSAASRSTPTTGRLSRELACARARRCMKGDRLALSGVKPLAGTDFLNTSPVRIASINTIRIHVHTKQLRSKSVY